MDLLDKVLGKLLLGIAIAWSAATVVLNPVRQTEFAEERTIKDRKAVQVELDQGRLAQANPEVFFPDRDPKSYQGGDHFPFMPPLKVFEFQPVDLGVPSSLVISPPDVLPSPGPTLEGTASLPRWGKSLPPVDLPPPDPKQKKGP